MSFLEWWGESVDPGEVGTLKVGKEHEPCVHRWLVIVRFAFVAVAVPLLWFLAIPRLPLPLWQSALLVMGGTLIYVALGYLIDPQPEFGNIGWGHGLFDHPWRYSDDLNRLLIALAIALGPGRFVAESLLDARLLFRQPDEPAT